MVKLRGATLLETLVATVLILVIFLVSGLIINNLAKNTIQNNHHSIEVELKRLGYFGLHQKISLPYSAEFKNWNIEVTKNADLNSIEIEAWRDSDNTVLNHKIYDVE